MSVAMGWPGHAGHASCPSLDCCARDQQQLRLQLSVAGSLARDLSCAAGGRARRNDDWHRSIPGSKRIAPGPDADTTFRAGAGDYPMSRGPRESEASLVENATGVT